MLLVVAVVAAAAVVTHTFNSSTQEVETRQSPEFEASLGSRVRSRTAKTTLRNPVCGVGEHRNSHRLV